MSTSLVMLEVQGINDLDRKLKDIAYEDEDMFRALSFDSNSKTSGEMHWSNSFKHGKMNMVSFIKEENYFYLFTSSVENKKVLDRILTKLLSQKVKLVPLKTPLNSMLTKNIDIPELERVEVNKYFGISAWLNIQGWRSMVKIYTNGLITYRMTDDLRLIKEIIAIAKKLIAECELDNEV